MNQRQTLNSTELDLLNRQSSLYNEKAKLENAWKQLENDRFQLTNKKKGIELTYQEINEICEREVDKSESSFFHEVLLDLETQIKFLKKEESISPIKIKDNEQLIVKAQKIIDKIQDQYITDESETNEMELQAIQHQKEVQKSNVIHLSLLQKIKSANNEKNRLTNLLVEEKKRTKLIIDSQQYDINKISNQNTHFVQLEMETNEILALENEVEQKQKEAKELQEKHRLLKESSIKKTI